MKELEKDAVSHWFQSTDTVSNLTKEVLEGAGDFKIWQVICTVRYTDNLVVPAKGKTVLLNIAGTLIEIVRYGGMDINVEKTKVMTISRYRLRLPKNKCRMWNISSVWVTMITHDARRTSEIKYRMAMAKAAFNKKKTQLLTPTHAQLRHSLKFIKKPYKNSYMFWSTTIFRELQCPR